MNNKSGDDRSVHTGNVTGAQIITGNKNKVTMHGVQITLTHGSNVDIKAELAGLREVLQALNTEDRGKIDRALADAEEEAAKETPDKDEIGNAIERVAKYTREASNVTEHAVKIGERLGPIVSWLGEGWTSILDKIGMAG